jgi:peptide chain release factor 3
VAFELNIRGGRLGDVFLHRTAHPVRIAGTAGLLQFDVVAYRLKEEYGGEEAFEGIDVQTARWVTCADPKKLREFRDRYTTNLATDAACGLVYFATSMINLRLVQEKWPDVSFAATRELAPMLAA